MRRRAAIVFLVLLGAYAGTLGLRAFDSVDYAGDEPHYLLAAHSLIHDRNLDVLDEYRERDYERFYQRELDRHGEQTEGRLNEPHGAGFPLLISPAYALGGAKAVELFLAAIAALAGALAYLLAVRVVPDPWAIGAALAAGLSPPLLAYGTAVYPEPAAAAALCGAALLALRLEEQPGRRTTAGCFLLLATLPWLGTKFVLPGIVIGWFAARALLRHRRRLWSLVGVEVAAFSVALYVGVNEALYGGPTPYSAEGGEETGTKAAFPLGYLERTYRLAALLVDREYGLLRWAPLFALALLGVWLLWRARRGRLVRVLPSHRRAEAAATLCAAAVGMQVLVAAFLAPTMFGFWFPPRHLLPALPLAVPLVAWGLRHVPRTGSALAAIGLAASVWLYLEVRLGDAGLAAGRPDAPWGPLEAAFPLFDDGSTLPYALAAGAGAGLVALLLIDEREWRRRRGRGR